MLTTPCPALNISFDQPIMDNVLESISQIDGQVVIKVFGDDSTTLQQQGQGDVHRHRGRAWGGYVLIVDRAGETQTVIDKSKLTAQSRRPLRP